MTDKPRNNHPSDRVGGGGAAASAGIRFQQQLGALFSSWILAGDRFEDSFRLGAATPEWIRFETEAPVDDLLVKTTNCGYVAVQAKTTVSLSEDLSSPLGKTIVQFVRHWFVAQQGDGSMEWNRPLNPALDRLVLAVSPQASIQVKADLPAALRIISQPGGGALNQAQQRAYQVFCSLVKQAWASITKNPLDDRLLPELAELVAVFTYDGDRGYALASGSLIKAFGPYVETATAFTALSDICGSLMKERGGGDLSLWRQLLASRGVMLSVPPEYRADIEVLKRHSKRISETLDAYEKIEVAGNKALKVRRDCQTAVEAAARNGPLLIIGEPGAGKSGVLNALARVLAEEGGDVLELAVDRYSVETLEGLSGELGLEHSLLQVLEAWDGPQPAYLVIDALDATRGGRGEGVFRALIERVLAMKGRWSVVASIRNFDLRMGQQFRALFKGAPPDPLLADPSFAGVQHIQVPSWSDREFEQLLQQSPALAACLAQAPARLRELAMVPFNTRLMSEMIAGGAGGDFGVVSSQADLLRVYWDHRVGGHGMPAATSLSRVVQLMISARALRAPRLQAAAADPAMIDTLCKEGVLVVVDNDRWIQFRHHLLFDYAAARLALEPSEIVSGAYRFTKAAAQGLMLSPALGFVLREIWESERDHARFWTALVVLINDEDGDPIIRSTAGRLGAEFPVEARDCLWIGYLAVSGDEKARKTLSHVAGALAVRLEDEKQINPFPWVHLAALLANTPAPVSGILRFFLNILTDRARDAEFEPMLGQAARALFAHGLTEPDGNFIVRSAIDFVINTYGTDVGASRALMKQLFNRDRLDRFGQDEVPAVCYKITTIGEFDPEFVSEIYGAVFGYDVADDRETQIDESQILRLTSNASQDYGMARWSLGEYLPKFLRAHPRAAITAIVNAVDGYIVRRGRVSHDALDVRFSVGGRSIHLREDHSYIWANDPDQHHGHDAESLIAKLREHLRSVPETEANELIDVLIDQTSFAIFWSRMFLCAVERDDGLIDQLWSIAATELFLVLPDTRKDAIDVVARGFIRRTPEEQRSLEETALTFDFSRFQYRAEARQAFLERLFSAIGRGNLLTDEARSIIAVRSEEKNTANERLFVINSTVGSGDDFHWIQDLDREKPENSSLIAAIRAAKQLLQLEGSSGEVAAASLAESLATLDAIRILLVTDAPNVSLRRHAEGIIGQGCEIIVSRQLLRLTEVPPTSDQESSFLALLDFASRSENPETSEDTEARFEESASWSSPAARVEAAQACWDLLKQRPDLSGALIPRSTALLSDRHPAVRLTALKGLSRLWDIDRDLFWQLLADRAAYELNLTVITHVLGALVSRLIHADQQRSLRLLLALVNREPQDSDRGRRLREAAADKLTILWVTYQLPEAKIVLDGWLNPIWEHAKESKTILRSLRGAVVAGIGHSLDKDTGLRQRSQALISDIVDAANARLAQYRAAPDDEPISAEVRECAQIIDIAGNEMYFATGDAKLGRAGLRLFLRENAKLLEKIGEHASPHTTYYLLQLVERLVDVDAAKSFDLAASYLEAGSRSGYQNEHMGVDLLVRLIGVFLADHKEIFEVQARRDALVNSLEIFLDAGWPAARRLLYRLPELIH
ncbi:ATP-binding protein [uncultured Agrobacterium sp.]|uniref:ATP-binding protein n=1 Tax=uncultured Agrobacterium sp. TaxID=157277 RepID=UPI0025E1DDCF|nr:ATP-binding protein [uncultured Agrobacterium sp.]